MGWATLLSPVGPEWSGAVGWATLLAPWSRVERCCGLGDPISPVVPSGAVLWAGRPY